jgi:PmbA/TldA metallopeptidase C-terminal domain
VVPIPSHMADLMIDLLWGADAIAAAQGRSVFSGSDGATRLGERMSHRPIRLFSDPAMPGQECEPWLLTNVSSDFASVFDYGLPRGATEWIKDGRLNALVSSRAGATDAGVPLALAPDNLTLDAGGVGSLDDLVARCDDGLLITCTWYNRMVDQETHLITGLTRDGVYLVRDGEVVGAAGNFRFNCSPLAMLDQILDASAPVAALGREMADYFTRTTMPALLATDFNLSSVSEAV